MSAEQAVGIERAEPWAATSLVVGPFEFWPSEGMLRVDGAVVALTPREFQVLHALMAHARHVVSREQIHAEVWGTVVPGQRDRSVDVHIRKLRAKLGAATPRWEAIHTHFGVGYRFEPVLLERSAAARRSATHPSLRRKRP